MRYESLQLVLDANGDGRYQRWEIMDFLHGIYYLPGNLILETLGQWPWATQWLGIRASEATGYASLNSLSAVAVSLVFWAAVVFAALSLRLPRGSKPAAQTTPAADQTTLSLPPPPPPSLRY